LERSSSPLSKTFIPQGFTAGLAAPLRGWRFIAGNRSLWPHVVVPVLVNIVLTLLTFIALVALAVWFVATVHPWFHKHGWTGWGVGYVLEVLFAIVLLIVAAAGTMVAWIIINSALCGVFYARLARAVEVLLGTPRDELKDVSILGDATDTVAEVAALLGWNALWLLVGIVPLVGAPVAIAGSSYTNGFLFGSQFIGIPLAIRGIAEKSGWPTAASAGP
jgi:uncharacterized protein involved in cysteine biosynthesis